MRIGGRRREGDGGREKEGGGGEREGGRGGGREKEGGGVEGGGGGREKELGRKMEQRKVYVRMHDNQQTTFPLYNRPSCYAKSPTAGNFSVNTSPHQPHWGDQEMGTAFSCTECSEVAGLLIETS